ncbi:saccharopine dehydrogenase C-terminal domain-containing protein [Turneriella parva]|uniref:Homospermidine synthase n=1 Tax=Turneriella parva (strain ATCC BAA-1111 / DSM 21527 / NCTC 11395 / H) TaxID=869212 RepID=I4B4N9_TURPD|nr:saccharopine dehydrogenase C-terminal domain-containing protein [Turneriella parva]AFM12246.1 homospermidine synthase [Turneriella parva DSM 21527]
MKIVILGIGAVGKCCLHLIDHFVDIDPHNVYLIERSNQSTHYTVNAFIQRGAVYLQRSLNRENTVSLLCEDLKLKRGDLVIDLTTDSDMFFTVEVCLARGFMYLNTCIESSADEVLLHYRNHEKMSEIVARLKATSAQPTVLFDQGMNPGLISAFAQQGLQDIASHVLAQRKDIELKSLLSARDFAGIARHLKLDALHCSELDTQTASRVPANSFVNTWSCPGFLVEALAPAQVAWGSHERTLPDGAELVRPRTAILPSAGWQTQARSYVPHREIQGMVIPHEEVFTLQKLLSRADYAPSVYFVYEVNRHTRECLQRDLPASGQGIVLTPGEHGLQGEDKVGCLFVLAANPLTGDPTPWCWWTGSILKTTDPVYSATVIQVAAGVLAGVKFMLENRDAGVLFPENLDHKRLLRDAAPFLGEIFSAPVDYHPRGTQLADFVELVTIRHSA